MADYIKDPTDVLDYLIDWTAWLSTGETITAHTCTAVGATVTSSTHTGTTVTAWLSGGTAPSTATLTCHITTSAGRQATRSVMVDVTSL